jgi:hypothetical protein
MQDCPGIIQDFCIIGNRAKMLLHINQGILVSAGFGQLQTFLVMIYVLELVILCLPAVRVQIWS